MQRVQRRLSREEESAAEARRTLEPLAEVVPREVLAKARLVVSELVTNDLRRAGPHSQTRPCVDVSAGVGLMHGMICGSAGEIVSKDSSGPRAPPTADVGRLWIAIVEDAVSLWGARSIGGASCVWFVIRW